MSTGDRNLARASRRSRTFRAGTPLGDVVPDDPCRPVRITLIVAYADRLHVVARVEGLPIDRISVAISVASSSAARSSAGPRHVWKVLAVDSVLYAGMWYAYERTRSAADALGLPGAGRPRCATSTGSLFFGHDPNVVLQQHFWHAPRSRWYDEVASTTYYTHFVFPVIAHGGPVGGQPAPVGAVHEALRHAARRRLRDVRAPARPRRRGWCRAEVPVPAVRPARPAHRRGFYDLGFKGFVKSYNVASTGATRSRRCRRCTPRSR